MDGLAEDESCRIRLPKSVQEEDSLLVQSNPKSTQYKDKWTVEVFRTWQAAREQKFCILDPGSVFKDYHLHRMQSHEEKLEDLASLSLNYWLTKFAQEVANKNEIVNSARGMFTEFRNAFELHCKRKCKQQTIEVIKLCIAFSNLFPNTRVWISKHAVLYRGIKVHPCDLNAGTQLVYHLINY